MGAISIHKEDYLPGGYTKKVLKGYLQFQQMQSVPISADRTRGARLFSDTIAEEWLESGIWDKETYNAYMKTLEDFFDFDRLERYTNEQILFQVDELRKDLLTYSSYEKSLKWRLKKIKSGVSHTWENNSNDHAYFNQRLENSEKSYIFNEESLESVKSELIKHNKVVVFADNHSDLNALLGIVIENPKNTEVCLFVKTNPLIQELTVSDFKTKSIFQPETNLRLELCTARNAGYDLRDKSLSEKLKPYLNEKIPVLVIGEHAVLTFEGADFEYTALLPLTGDKACKYAGLLPSLQDNIVRTIIKKVKPVWSYPFEKSFFGVERSTFNLISGVEHDKDQFMNMYSPTYEKNEFPAFTIQGNSWNKILEKRENNLQQMIHHHYDNQIQTIHNHYRQPDGKTIRMDALLFNNPQTKVEPFLAQDEGKQLFDIREFAKGISTEDPVFLINFLYFATGKLLNVHDSKRQEQEKLNNANFFIDGIYDMKRDKTTFPLYNKAYIATTKEGELRFGTQALSAGKIKINEYECNWEKDAVNSLQEKELIIYTPHPSKSDVNLFNGDFRQYDKYLGEGRLNLLIVNEELVCARKGPLMLSPFGVMLSFDINKEVKLIKEIGLKLGENGFYSIPENLSLKITLPENHDYQWKYNGANLLFKNGKDLMTDEKSAINEFKNEGWFDPLSMQTQETQVQQWVRGPRSVIGIDQGNRPFVAVFSGRTKESAGARFDEMNTILKETIPNIKDAINMDGGASACLGMIYKGEFFELSLPSCTTYTTTGMARPVNSFLLVEP
ncbi:MAG: phosphodiester glycosidase family protein [Thermotogota bacterium]|nr:phosphodiester glycosidase family protein [Thermotogota bacterium]